MKNLLSQKEYYIFDGGTGQELIRRGLEVKKTLWSASALIDQKWHQLLVDIHTDYIKAGADLIVTNTFSVRKKSFEKNNCLDQYEEALHNAGALAQKARQISKKDILIAGGIATQNNTYKSEIIYDEETIRSGFRTNASILNEYVDLFYLDVFCSIEEIILALEIIKEHDKPILLGLHFKADGTFPDGSTISQILQKIQSYPICGVIAACVAPETYNQVADQLKNSNMPFGFKVNAFESIPDDYIITEESAKQPNSVLGIRSDITPEYYLQFIQTARDNGASLLGGCCEITPEHIATLSNLR